MGGGAILRGVSQSDQSYQQILLWIRERELGDFFASLLEGLGPLALVGAQIAYLFEPLGGGASGSIAHIGGILESPDELSVFIADLREGTDLE